VWLAFFDPIVEMQIEDDGAPFNPLELPEPAVDSPLDARPVGGLGVHLVRRLMDEVVYSRVGDRNRLIVRKRLPNSGGA
jgi:serine/threonine-protein kinase RsbW